MIKTHNIAQPPNIPIGDEPRISKTSKENHHAKIAQRYAQNTSMDCIGAYVARWTSWCRSVLISCNVRDVIKNSQELITIQLFDSFGQIQENTHEQSKNTTYTKIIVA